MLRLLCAVLFFSAMSCQAAPPRLSDVAAIPHVGAAARETYQNAFLQSDLHRAFAIAPGGAWGWIGETISAEAASAAALDACQKHSEVQCVPYAVDNRVVFDEQAWNGLWGPYKNKGDAARVGVGNKRGMRFPNLAFASRQGKAMKLADWRGKVTVLHFWGSWCTPCKRELPALQKLATQFKGAADIAFVLLPVRESAAEAGLWLESQKLDLPLYDSGLKNSEEEFLKLAGGGKIRDRDIARVFPTTYVLDRHGVVVFSHAGPIEDWQQYAPLLRDVAARSGK